MSWEVRKSRDEVRIATSQTELVPAKEMKQKGEKKTQKKNPLVEAVHRRKINLHSSKQEEYFASKSSNTECGAKSGGLMVINILKGQ